MATTPTTTTPPSTPTIYNPINIDYLNESWCELQYKSGCSSTGSISHLNHSVNPEVLEKLLNEAQKDSQSPLLPHPILATANPLNIKSFDSFSAISAAPSTTTSIVAATGPLVADITVLSKSPNSSFQEVDKSLAAVKKMSSSVTGPQSQAIKTSSLNGNGHAAASTAVPTENVFMPIKTSGVHQSTMFVYDDLYGGCDEDDDDVDLEYAEESENENSNELSNKKSSPIGSNNTFTEASNMPQHNQPKLTSSSVVCKSCTKQRDQIKTLLEKQINLEKEQIRLRNEYEVKLLNMSLEVSHHSSSSSSAKSAKLIMSSSPSPLSPPSLSANLSGIATPIYPLPSVGKTASESSVPSLAAHQNEPQATISTKDWMKYFASRPQSQPPKDWNNLVHPNSHLSKLRKLDDSPISTVATAAAVEYSGGSVKLLSTKAGVESGSGGMSLSKIIFTHVASFIVGATLMFLVLKRHLNMKGSVYFV